MIALGMTVFYGFWAILFIAGCAYVALALLVLAIFGSIHSYLWACGAITQTITEAKASVHDCKQELLNHLKDSYISYDKPKLFLFLGCASLVVTLFLSGNL